MRKQIQGAILSQWNSLRVPKRLANFFCNEPDFASHLIATRYNDLVSSL